MAFDFGGPVMSETVPVENAAGRENRDLEQIGVENKYTEVEGGSVRDYSSATASTVASTATGGRKNRDVSQRLGDDKLAYNPADWRSPTLTTDPDGRNDREYVDRTTGNSAITGAKADDFDANAAASSGNGGLWPF